MRTPTTFGIEYSFVPKFDMPGVDPYHKVEEMASKCEHSGFPSAHEDGSALEVPSPIHRSMTQAKRFYTRLVNFVYPRKMVAQRVDVDHEGNEDYYGTGGGHIHIGVFGRKLRTAYGSSDNCDMTEKDYLIVRNLAVLVANRPWLGWVFNEFMDNINAKAITGRGMLCRQLAKKGSQIPQTTRLATVMDPITLMHKSVVKDNNKWAEAFHNIRHGLGKNWAINLSQPEDQYTMEFRFFDAPKSWPQVQEHVDFVMALYRYAKRATRAGKYIKLEQRGLEAIKGFRNRDKVERDFKRTCRILGLEWSRYAKYMANYDDRAEFGSLT